MNLVDLDPPPELGPDDHRRLHNEARLLVAMYGDVLGLPAERRVTGCPFDRKPDPAHPLARYMREHTRA